MPYPEILNHSRFAHALMLLADEAGCPLVVPILQASFDIGKDGSLALPEQTPPIALAGETWDGAEVPTWRLEPQTAFDKPGCDLVLLGHAHAPRPGCTQMEVSFRLGSLARSALVHGDRWLLQGRRLTSPKPFERIPLRYERAFGGRDRRAKDPSQHSADPRNDAGLGFRDRRLPVDPEVQWPNIEDPRRPMKSYGDTPPPIGFGFVSPHWQPRVRLAGTYDEAWVSSRMPLLPQDFDRRYFNAASPGLIGAVPPSGGEPVSVIGTTPQGRLDFALPHCGRPLFELSLRGRQRRVLKLKLDTVIVDTDQRRLTLQWRAHLPLRNGLHDIVAGAFHLPDAASKPWRRGHHHAQV